MRLMGFMQLIQMAFFLAAAVAQSCDNQQVFPQEEDAYAWVNDLTPNVPANATLCPGHWVWFRIATLFSEPSSNLRRTGNTWNLESEGEIQQHALSIALDAGYDEIHHRFTTLSLLAVNGTPPTNILDSNPYGNGDEYRDVMHVYEAVTDRETITFGFNDTIGHACQQPLDNLVYIGVKCIHPPGNVPGPCRYNLTVAALPHSLRNGMSFDAYLRPASLAGGYVESVRHYFRMSVSSYETLSVEIMRQGEGRPLYDASGVSLGLGFAGGVYVQRLGEQCPANGSAILEQVHLRYPILAALYRLSLPTSLQVCVIGLNDTTPCTIGHACSSVEHSTAELVMMIQAVVGDDRPPTYIDAPNSDYAVDCETAQLCQVMTPHEPPVAERQMHRRPEG